MTAKGYFSRISKAQVLEALTEMVGVEEAGRIAGMKKVDMAEAAERLLEGRGWLSPVLRSENVEPDMKSATSSGGDAYSYAAE